LSPGGGRLTLTPEQYDQLIAHARREAPRECCGLIGGRDGRAIAVYEIPNTRKNNLNYLMEPQALYDALHDIEGRGLQLVAIYHSHPETEAYPSATDIADSYWGDDPDSPLYPGVVYVIISLADPERPVVRGFYIESAQVRETKVVVV